MNATQQSQEILRETKVSQIKVHRLENFQSNAKATSAVATVDSHPNLVVRVAKTQVEREDIYRFRYEHYVVGMGRDKTVADHQNKMLVDSLDDTAVQIGAYYGDELVGCARVNFSCYTELPEDELYGFSEYEAQYPGKLSLTSKVIVAPAHRGTRIFLKLARQCCEEAGRRQMQRNFIATADKLVPIFKKLGFIAHRPRFESWADYGSSNPMLINLNQVDYLRSINSPFVDIAERYYAQPKKSFFLEKWIYPHIQSPFELRFQR